MKTKRPITTTQLYLLILIFGGIWIWGSRSEAGDITQVGVAAPQKGFLAPDFSLQTIKGETLTLSEFRGQVVLLNLWTSWCAPCRVEMPALESTFIRYRSQGAQILAVNATNQDDTNKAIAFAQELGLSFSILFDQDGAVSRLYQLRALPTTFFIDAHGVIQEVVVGGPMSEALLRTRVEALLETLETDED